MTQVQSVTCCLSVHSGAVAYSNAYFGRGSGPYHLVSCSGSESSLLSCRRGYSIGVHNCTPGNEAGVKCAIASSKCEVPLCTESTLHGVSTYNFVMFIYSLYTW